jgi:hypothetical protein
LADAEKVREILATIPEAEGTYVRCERMTLVVGRKEALGPRGQMEDDDRLRLTWLGGGAYGIWARLADGEYRFTEIAETVPNLRHHLAGPFLHYLRAWTRSSSPPKGRRGTSGTRH